MYLRGTKLECVNELRYKIFRAKGAKLIVAPCEDALQQHTVRANYQAGIWRRSLDNMPNAPEPEGHGWTKDSKGTLCIQWIVGAPAPQVVLDMVIALQRNVKSTAVPACKIEWCVHHVVDERDVNLKTYWNTVIINTTVIVMTVIQVLKINHRITF